MRYSLPLAERNSSAVDITQWSSGSGGCGGGGSGSRLWGGPYTLTRFRQAMTCVARWLADLPSLPSSKSLSPPPSPSTAFLSRASTTSSQQQQRPRMHRVVALSAIDMMPLNARLLRCPPVDWWFPQAIQTYSRALQVSHAFSYNIHSHIHIYIHYHYHNHICTQPKKSQTQVSPNASNLYLSLSGLLLVSASRVSRTPRHFVSHQTHCIAQLVAAQFGLGFVDSSSFAREVWDAATDWNHQDRFLPVFAENALASLFLQLPPVHSIERLSRRR
jgi:hypothetical protein